MLLKRIENTTFGISLSYGITAGITYCGLFLLIKLLGLEHYHHLRHLNLILMTLFTYKAMLRIKLLKNHTRYLPSLANCMFIACSSFAIFSIFLIIWLQLDRSYMDFLIHNGPFGRYLNPMDIGFYIASEGIGSQPVISLVLLQLPGLRSEKPLAHS